MPDNITEEGRTKKNITERPKAQPLRSFEFLSKSATEMIDLPDLDSIYTYICVNIQKQYPDSIVLIVSVEEAKRETRLIHVAGLEKSLQKKITGISGYNPLWKSYKLLPKHHELWKSGNLSEFPGGLTDFAASEFPLQATMLIQKMLGIQKIYTIGINKEEKLLSAVHIFTRNKTQITGRNFLELFVKQAGIVIQRKLFEDQLRLHSKIQDILYNIACTSLKDVTLEELLTVVQKELNKVMDANNFFVALYKPDKETLKKVIFRDEEDDFAEWSTKNSLSGQVVTCKKSILMDEEEISRFAASYPHKLLGAPAKCWLGVPILVGEKAVGAMVIQSYRNQKAYDNDNIRLMEIIAHELSLVIQNTKMIEDLKAAKEKAEQSDRLKSAFLANMSHEIRTPMNGIMGFLSLLSRPDLKEVNRMEFIHIVNKSGERLMSTINDIIEISKIEAGEKELTFTEVDISETMQYFHCFFNIEAKEKGLEFILSENMKEDTAIVLTDKNKLDSILTNLIKNAIKFTKKGSIEFGSYLEKESMVFYVKDSGIGIPANRTDAIFDRFVQADLNLTRGHEGSGLGLAISKAYAEALKGKIRVDSETGKGSTFFLSIPWNPVKKKALPDQSDVIEKGELKGLTILVAEDDYASSLYFEKMIEYENINLIQTADGAETVKALKENPQVSLILMDIQMPVMDGLEATRQIRKFNKTIPIIAQTAYGFPEDEKKALEAGCTDYIAKPIRSKELFSLIKKYTNHSI